MIIACLDAADTLGAQLEALAGQSCPVEWELLLCDNGSTDSSREVAERYRSRLPALRIIDASSRRGAGPARNLGATEARGRWLAFCDADDVVAEGWLDAMCAALADHTFVAGRFEYRRLNDSRVLRSRLPDQQEELQASDVGPGLPHAGGGNMGVHREVFLAVGGFDPTVRWLEDTDFSWRVQLAGHPLVFRPDAVVHVRLRRTFRSMYRQGREYGQAQRLLDERYGRLTAADPSAAPAPRTAEPRRSWTVRRLPTWFYDHLVGGRLAWRIGWVLGHRDTGSSREPRLQGEGRDAASARPTVEPPTRPRVDPTGDVTRAT